jgi:hypothetical protein
MTPNHTNPKQMTPTQTKTPLESANRLLNTMPSCSIPAQDLQTITALWRTIYKAWDGQR